MIPSIRCATDQRPSFDQLCDLALSVHHNAARHICMLFHCFLDDSKDKSQTQVYISAGFIGIEDDWKAFRILWNEILSTNNIRYFKSSEYNWLEGEFSRFKTDAYPRPSGRQ